MYFLGVPWGFLTFPVILQASIGSVLQVFGECGPGGPPRQLGAPTPCQKTYPNLKVTSHMFCHNLPQIEQESKPRNMSHNMQLTPSREGIRPLEQNILPDM